jgi:hypothetical protein
MKKIILFVTMLMIAVFVFSQQTNPSPTLTKQDYIKKRKHQEIAALCLGGAGFVVWAAGANKYMNQEDNVDGGGEAAMVVGGLSCLASIPLFIIGSKNRKKARLMAINNQRVPQIQNNSFVFRSIPSITFKISL